MLALMSEKILYKYMARVHSEGEMEKSHLGAILKRSCKISPCVQVPRGIILFSVHQLLDIELLGKKEMSSFPNEHTTILPIFCQDFVFSRDYEKSQNSLSCKCAWIILSPLHLKMKENVVLFTQWSGTAFSLLEGLWKAMAAMQGMFFLSVSWLGSFYYGWLENLCLLFPFMYLCMNSNMQLIK